MVRKENTRTLEVGKTLMVFLKNRETVIGELILLKDTHIRLKNPIDFLTKEPGSSNIYFHNEIEKIKIIANSTEELETSKLKQRSKPRGTDKQENKMKEKNDELVHRIKMAKEKVDKVTDIINHYVYICTYDRKYWDAIKEIKGQRSVGVNIENVEFGRKSRASLLSIATESSVYIFDLLLLYPSGGIPKELKSILESWDIKIIMHNSKKQLDYLKHVCQVTVHNPFDTMVSRF